MLLAAALAVTTLIIAGCSDPPSSDANNAAALGTSEWPVLGESQPVLGVDLYALSNYSAAEVEADGERTLDYIKNVLKANAVGIVWNLYSPDPYKDTVKATSATLSASNVRILTRIANYYRAELPYLKAAQQLRVREFVVGTELSGLNLSPSWPSFFARVSQVYHGVISYSSWDGNYFGYAPGTPFKVASPQLTPVKYLGMDMYWPIGLPPNATTAEVTTAWEALFGKMPLSILRRTAIDETGIQARASAYNIPEKLDAKGTRSEEVQVNWFTAACTTVRQYHMRGVFFFKVDLTDYPAHPATSLKDKKEPKPSVTAHEFLADLSPATPATVPAAGALGADRTATRMGRSRVDHPHARRKVTAFTVAVPRSACGRDRCLVHSGNTFPRHPGGRPILVAYDSECSEPLQTCPSATAARQGRRSPAGALAGPSAGCPGSSLSPHMTTSTAIQGQAA